MNELDSLARIQHVYDFATLDRVPDSPTSARVTAWHTPSQRRAARWS